MPKATKAELRREIAELREFGRQMSNLCFNIGQNAGPRDSKSIAGPTLGIMYDLSKRWDLIKRAESSNA